MPEPVVGAPRSLLDLRIQAYRLSYLDLVPKPLNHADNQILHIWTANTLKQLKDIASSNLTWTLPHSKSRKASQPTLNDYLDDVERMESAMARFQVVAGRSKRCITDQYESDMKLLNSMLDFETLYTAAHQDPERNDESPYSQAIWFMDDLMEKDHEHAGVYFIIGTYMRCHMARHEDECRYLKRVLADCPYVTTLKQFNDPEMKNDTQDQTPETHQTTPQ